MNGLVINDEWRWISLGPSPGNVGIPVHYTCKLLSNSQRSCAPQTIASLCPTTFIDSQRFLFILWLILIFCYKSYKKKFWQSLKSQI